MFWGPWHRSVYHTVNVIKFKSCQYLLANGGAASLCSSNSPPSVWLDCGPRQYQTWHGHRRRQPRLRSPERNLMLFLIQYDLARGIQQQKIKKYCVCAFVYVHKYDKSSYSPSRLPHTISVFAVILFLDRGTPLWQIADTVVRYKTFSVSTVLKAAKARRFNVWWVQCLNGTNVQ